MRRASPRAECSGVGLDRGDGDAAESANWFLESCRPRRGCRAAPRAAPRCRGRGGDLRGEDDAAGRRSWTRRGTTGAARRLGDLGCGRAARRAANSVPRCPPWCEVNSLLGFFSIETGYGRCYARCITLSGDRVQTAVAALYSRSSTAAVPRGRRRVKTTRAAGSSRSLRLGCGVTAQLQRAGGSVRATDTAAVLTNTTPPRRAGGTGTPRCGWGGDCARCSNHPTHGAPARASARDGPPPRKRGGRQESAHDRHSGDTRGRDQPGPIAPPAHPHDPGLRAGQHGPPRAATNRWRFEGGLERPRRGGDPACCMRAARDSPPGSPRASGSGVAIPRRRGGLHGPPAPTTATARRQVRAAAHTADPTHTPARSRTRDDPPRGHPRAATDGRDGRDGRPGDRNPGFPGRPARPATAPSNSCLSC